MELLSPKKATELLDRINRLQPESKGKWGKMTVEEMLIHCAAGIQMAFGDFPAKLRVSPFRAMIARLLFIEIFPFPKRASAPPEINIGKKLKIRMPFSEARTLLIEQVIRIQNAPIDHRFQTHPIFNNLSRRQWGRLAYKHLDYHLKQFGV
jgi:hypothetical protein